MALTKRRAGGVVKGVGLSEGGRRFSCRTAQLPCKRHHRHAAEKVAREALERAAHDRIEVIAHTAHFAQRAQMEAARLESHGRSASMRPAKAARQFASMQRAMGTASDTHARDDRGREYQADFAPRVDQLPLQPQARITRQRSEVGHPRDDA